jgi:hypothetical protein
MQRLAQTHTDRHMRAYTYADTHKHAHTRTDTLTFDTHLTHI